MTSNSLPPTCLVAEAVPNIAVNVANTRGNNTDAPLLLGLPQIGGTGFGCVCRKMMDVERFIGYIFSLGDCARRFLNI